MNRDDVTEAEYIDYLEKEIEKPFSEQIRAKDKWINELLLEVDRLKNEKDE